jgi:predicted phosphodiesterase
MAREFVIVSDIHGNAPALQAVIDAEGTSKEYIILGDIHGLLGYPKETLELVREVGDFVLAGNHDKALFHYDEGHVNSDELSDFELEHTLSNLSEEDIAWMEDLPYMEVIQRGGVRIAICHAYPWPSKSSGYEPGNTGISKKRVPSVASTVEGDYDYVFHGHTHVQYEQDCSKFGHDVHFVNPGSLGYENEYATVNIETGEVTLKSVDVDMGEVKDHVQKHLPENAPHTNEWFKF